MSRRQSGSDLLLAFLGQIHGEKVEGIRLNNGRSIGCNSKECPSISRFVAGLGEEAVRGGGEIVVFLSHRRTPEPSGLD